MNSEYVALKSLQAHVGYEVLKALWIHQLIKIEEARDRAAEKSSAKAESDWRHQAGIAKGFKIAVGQLEKALAEMELAEENKAEESNTDRILKQLDDIKAKHQGEKP